MPMNNLIVSHHDSTAHLRLVRIRTLNEIAFIAGDRAHGGPPREPELADLQRTLRELDERIAAGAPSR
jgi:hypothetical protein